MEQVQNTAEQQGLAKSGLIFSILGTAFSGSGILGLIFSLIAGGKNKKATAAGATGGMVKAANILQKIGLIVSIVVTVLYVISFIAGVVQGLNG
ncbi:MAG: hypothetical protein IJ138_10465 [Clostridia bacterium]|nr:hypothetical protein [Clostridia bacterium]MBR3272125.1 hypothetical protein [Clostridia bacterium]